MDNLDIKQEAQMMFDILLDKKADYIDFLLEKPKIALVKIKPFVIP